MIRLYVPSLARANLGSGSTDVPRATIRIEGEELRYLMLARRSRVGDSCQLFDGQGLIADGAIAAIATAHADIVLTAPPRQAPVIAPRIAVLQALIKGDRMDVCIEKLVETGADEIILVAAERSVVKLASASSSNRQARWQAQVAAAARQSARAYTPQIAGPFGLTEAITKIGGYADRRATDPHGQPWPRAPDNLPHITTMSVSMPNGPVSSEADRGSDVAIAVGPEGGFTTSEYELLARHGFTAYAISPHVLRAETAGPVAVALTRVPL